MTFASEHFICWLTSFRGCICRTSPDQSRKQVLSHLLVGESVNSSMNRGQYLWTFMVINYQLNRRGQNIGSLLRITPIYYLCFTGFVINFFDVCTGSFTKTCVNILGNKSVSEFDSDSVVVSFPNSFDESVPQKSMCLVFPITSNLWTINMN